MTDEKQQLLSTLKAKDIKGYFFSLVEDEYNVVASLTNNSVRKPIDLNTKGIDTILAYTLVKDKKANTTQINRCEVETKGASVTIIVKDMVTGKEISRNSFPSSKTHEHPERTGFETIEQCIEDFRCKRGGELQCEANRTCRPQFAGFICCLNNGNCFSVHLVFRPDSLRCQILSTANVPQLEGLVLSR